MTAATTTLTRPRPTTLRIDDRLASAAAWLVAALVALALVATVVAGMLPSGTRSGGTGPAPTAQPTLAQPAGSAQLPMPAPLPQPGAPTH